MSWSRVAQALCIGVVAVALGWLLASAGQAADEQALLSDRRLATRVTFYRESLMLGDLCALLSERTGAAVRTNPDDPEMGALEIAIGLPDVDAATVMASIVSLQLGNARWRWDGRGTRDAPYTLVCLPRTTQLSAAARLRLEADFQAHAQEMLNVARLDPGAQARYLDEHPELSLRRRPSEESLLGARAIAELPDEVRGRVFRGERIRLRLNELPASGQQLVRERWRQAQSLNPGNPAYTGEAPEDILIARETHVGWLTPVIVIQPGRLGAHGYVGGGNLEEWARRRDARDWMVDADNTDLPDGQIKEEVPAPEVTFPPNSPLAGKRAKAGMLPGRFIKWLSRTYRVPIISNLGSRREGLIGAAQFRRSLREHLRSVGEAWPVLLKQRRGVVIIHDRAWFTDPTFAAVPFPVVIRMREVFRNVEPHRAVVLRGLGPTASLTEGGCLHLTRYFPIVQLAHRTAGGLTLYANAGTSTREKLERGETVRMPAPSVAVRQRLEALSPRDPDAPYLTVGTGGLQFDFAASDDGIRFGYIARSADGERRAVPLLRRRNKAIPFLVAPEETDDIIAWN